VEMDRAGRNDRKQCLFGLSYEKGRIHSSPPIAVILIVSLLSALNQLLLEEGLCNKTYICSGIERRTN